MNALLALSFALGGAGFVVLAVLTLTRWRDHPLGRAFPFACGLQAGWCFLMSTGFALTRLPAWLPVATELARNLAWISLLAGVLFSSRSVAARHRLWMQAGAMLAVCVLIVVTLVASNAVSAAALLAEEERWGGLLCAIAGLVLVEQFARNAREDLRWHLKHLCLGIALLFMLELVVWSMALLTNRVDALLWTSRAVVNLFVAALLGLGVQRLRGWRGSLFRSERNYFFNTTLALAGVYVLLMSAASWWLAQVGEVSRPFVTAMFWSAAIVLLTVAVFSDQYRAWLRVTLSKLFLRYRYDYRGVWLQLTGALAKSSDTPVHDRIVAVMAAYVNSGGGALWLRDEEGNYRYAGGELRLKGITSVAHDEFLEWLRSHDWIYDLAVPQAPPIPSAPTWLGPHRPVWLVVPLLRDEQMVGFLLVNEPMTPTPLGWEQLDLLRVAGRQVAGFLALEQAGTKLAEMHQFEALNRLSAFVMHDLRHLVAQLAMVVDNASRHRQNPAFIDDAILTIESSVQRMNGLMEVLRTSTQPEQERRIDLAGMVEELLVRCSDRRPEPLADIETPGAFEIMGNRERLLQALEHLLRNAQDATPATGRITLRLRRKSQHIALDIADTGCGMEPEFLRLRLFKPFDTTKGEQGMGLGAYEARDIVRKLGGGMTVESEVGRGTCIQITLPPAPLLDSRPL